eukprot:TRINITY_DN6232_c0_g1_i3.p1 TRINITY_DN6232_c0_g1~~TRINITY_DN6232_c0_g1_i3.p1  ORF type:complete len:318 (+),score=12.96 TRINITY_DN6232_c0_g1_i3:121-1074(+)
MPQRKIGKKSKKKTFKNNLVNKRATIRPPTEPQTVEVEQVAEPKYAINLEFGLHQIPGIGLSTALRISSSLEKKNQMKTMVLTYMADKDKTISHIRESLPRNKLDTIDTIKDYLEDGIIHYQSYVSPIKETQEYYIPVDILMLIVARSDMHTIFRCMRVSRQLYYTIHNTKKIVSRLNFKCLKCKKVLPYSAESEFTCSYHSGEWACVGDSWTFGAMSCCGSRDVTKGCIVTRHIRIVYWDIVPSEVIMMILKNLDVRSVCRFERVSKVLNARAKEFREELWEHLVRRDLSNHDLNMNNSKKAIYSGFSMLYVHFTL